MACVALGCKSHMGVKNKETKTKVSFHRFPKDPVLKKKWIKNIRRKNWQPTEYSHLCSLHFDKSCYQKNNLHSDAVPTIFKDHTYGENTKPRRTRHSGLELSGVTTFNLDRIRTLNLTIRKQQTMIAKLQHKLNREQKISERRRLLLRNMQKKCSKLEMQLVHSENLTDDSLVNSVNVPSQPCKVCAERKELEAVINLALAAAATSVSVCDKEIQTVTVPIGDVKELNRRKTRRTSDRSSLKGTVTFTSTTRICARLMASKAKSRRAFMSVVHNILKQTYTSTTHVY